MCAPLRLDAVPDTARRHPAQAGEEVAAHEAGCVTHERLLTVIVPG